MKRILFIAVILLFAARGYAQKDSTFYKHEVRASFGDALVYTYVMDGSIVSSSISVAYFYRPLDWLWIGANFVNYFGETLRYEVREYFPDGRFRDFTRTKIRYSGAIAPEIRFSYLNRKKAILYCGLSAGIGLEDGYDSRELKYPQPFPYIHCTLFGFSCNFGQNKKGFLGGEIGIGYKSTLSIHGGYRF